MHRDGELKEQIMNTIRTTNAFDDEQKKVWSDIFTKLIESQEEALRHIASCSVQTAKTQQNIQCGIISPKEGGGSARFFMSVGDDLTSSDAAFFDKNPETRIKKDGDWSIVGIGYLDCSYQELNEICGRGKAYRGHSPNGEFTYSLVLKNTLLNAEKRMYRNAVRHHMNMPVIYAPLLRRLVYIETQADIGYNDVKKLDFQLEENGISCLKIGWRSVWSIEETDSPHGIKNNGKYKYKLRKNEYIVPKEPDREHLQINEEIAEEEKLISLSWKRDDDPKHHLLKVTFHPVSVQENIIENDRKLFFTKGADEQNVTHIHSRSDVYQVLKDYADFVHFTDVFTEPPENMTVCAYEIGFEYPLDPDYFQFSDRPALYLCFEYDEKEYFWDRVVYVVHTLQRRFPEYTWKGGYCK